MPNSYITICTAIYKSAEINEVFDLNSFNDGLLPLTLVINYKDVGGSVIYKTFKIEIKFFTKSINFREKEYIKINNMRGRVYIKEN